METEIVERVATAATAAAHAAEVAQKESTRRALFTVGGTAALALLVGEAGAQVFDKPKSLPPGWDAVGNWKSPTNRLVRRITYGIEPGEMALASILGFQGYLNRQLSPELIDDSLTEAAVATTWPKMSWTEGQLYRDTDQWDQFLQLLLSTMYRSTFSKRSLNERMVEFWTDHFNISIEKVPVPLLTAFVQKTIRKHAMGNFGDLLKATAHTSGMLNFLDNDVNTSYEPNINYARELHELHTVGAGGGYTGQDLRQAALVLSGWSWTWDPLHWNVNKFEFRPYYHADGDKTVMGQVYQSNGQQEGEDMLDFLSKHPKTAEFVTRKMVKWFLGDPAPEAVCAAAAAKFLSTGGDIREVLKVILTPANLMASNPRYKRPYHLFLSAVRSCKSQVTDYLVMLYLLYEAGMAPWYWSFPDGYPDRFDYWVGGQIYRLNFGLYMAANYISGVSTDVPGVFGADRTATGCLNVINQAFFGGEMATSDREALRAYLQNGAITDERLTGAIALAIDCPSFQWY